MTRVMAHGWFRWVPRSIVCLFAAYTALLALEAFNTGGPLWRQLVGFLVYPGPTALVIGTAIVGWCWPLMGGVLCFGLGLLYVAMTWGSGVSWSAYVTITGPIWTAGVLFFVEGFLSDR